MEEDKTTDNTYDILSDSNLLEDIVKYNVTKVSDSEKVLNSKEGKVIDGE